MNASELKFQVEQADPSTLFFSRSSMKFGGDTMRNYGVRSATVTDSMGTVYEVWELYRKHKTPKGFTSSAYFAKDTFKRVHA